jgi:Transcriptional regulators containing an AAA-type ATPase domain and a DNA-binding domain
MKRKDMVLTLIENLSRKVNAENIKEGIDVGFDANEIAEKLENTRNNITTDLNLLFKEGSLIKIKGKPVKFFSKKVYQDIMQVKLPAESIECSAIQNLGGKNEDAKTCDSFSTITGFDGSLRSQIKQAKAAVLYPPAGLHSLILGETGVGKSMFAELMYRYAVEKNVLKKNSPFVIFNCADYSNNPQLLISELFGVLKGAYTGADAEREGLIEQANGGIIFLDEVHRLPPEGQEMLFTVMDKGLYRKLGETKSSRKVQVLIIAATTEDTGSVLLKTFMRRIPMIIKIPPLKDRPIMERFELVKSIFTGEASRVKIPVRVDSSNIVPFLYYDCPGNIGQLYTDIQFTVARGFLEHISDGTGDINITSDMLPDHVGEALIKFPRRLWKDMDFISDEGYVFDEKTDTKENASAFTQYDLTRKLYEDIMQEASGTSGQSRRYEIVRQKIEELFHNYSRTLYRNFLYDRKRLLNYIPEDVLDITGEMLNIACNELDTAFENNLFISLAFHFNNLIIRNESGPGTNHIKVDNIEELYPREYATAKKMLRHFCSEYKLIKLPESEVHFITMFLAAKNEKKVDEGRVGILIAAHGNGVASGIADVVNRLLGREITAAIDVPLDERPEDTVQRCIEAVKRSDAGKGVLMLVDMGSLSVLKNRIKNESGVDVDVFEAINTPLIIDAARKAIIPGNSMKDILQSAVRGTGFLNRNLQKYQSRKAKDETSATIITVCLSGQGTAYALKNTIEKMLLVKNVSGVKVIPVSFVSKTQGKAYIERLVQESRVIAIAGNINPKVAGVPFIGIDEIILKKGLDKILDLIGIGDRMDNEISLDNLNEEITWDTTMEAVENYLQFFSINKIKSYVFDFIKKVESLFNINLKLNTRVKLFVHITYMLERLKFRDSKLPAEDSTMLSEMDLSNLRKIYAEFSTLNDMFKIDIPFEEADYIYQILKDEGLFSHDEL